MGNSRPLAIEFIGRGTGYILQECLWENISSSFNHFEQCIFKFPNFPGPF